MKKPDPVFEKLLKQAKEDERLAARILIHHTRMSDTDEEAWDTYLAAQRKVEDLERASK